MFRCDATAATGWGHISRCLALAEAFQEQGWRTVVAGCFDDSAHGIIVSTGSLARRLAATVNTRDDAVCTASLLREASPDLLVCDSYAADRQYLDSLRYGPAKMTLFDDFGRWAGYPCGAILNFTIGSAGLAYQPDGRLLLLGPAYFPARKRLRESRKSRPNAKPA